MATKRKVYEVRTEGDVEGRSMKTIGYATGDPKDIEIYFENQIMYEIKVEPIEVVHVTRNSVAKRRALLEEQEKLQVRLGELENLLRGK